MVDEGEVISGGIGPKRPKTSNEIAPRLGTVAHLHLLPLPFHTPSSCLSFTLSQTKCASFCVNHNTIHIVCTHTLDELVESTFIPTRALILDESKESTEAAAATKNSNGFKHLPPSRISTLTPAARCVQSKTSLACE